ncbi:MAG: lipid-A-disaccharide synthase [Bacteroidetes bacterium]|nr:lipid-A-disaccharide synthase [Bacteroidota bacterium]MBK9048106.1 lipid-A-disaccharide synthase [Bacteroidota bacterium]MBL0073945.1 lipid-A-disaccharide synthase [Bacteroidota bacterium]
MKYYVIAGEASGDLHASNLIKHLKNKDAGFTCRAWGGDLMKEQGVDLVKHYRDLAFMGFIEVVANLRTILRNIDFCKKDILAYKPDVLILVDYPGFNLRIADFAAKNGIHVIYYISPQIWAWKQSRIHQIKRNVNRMIVILPFEKDFYRKHDFNVDFVGHPLLDAISNRARNENANSFKSLNKLSDKPIIALLPGSRKQEIKTMLPLMLSVRNQFPDYQFVIGAAPSLEESFYKDITGNSDISIVFGQTYPLLENAYAALVTSGTATLETALFGVPEVVCYKGSLISYHIARQLIKIKYISLVNLIMDREVVTELIQDDLNPARIKEELTRITLDETGRNRMLQDYESLKQKLGGTGASERAANLIWSDISGES